MSVLPEEEPRLSFWTGLLLVFYRVRVIPLFVSLPANPDCITSYFILLRSKYLVLCTTTATVKSHGGKSE